MYTNINLNDTKKIIDFLKENSIEYVYHIAAIANARRSIEDVVETMDVNELAIEANEKGELEHDTIHDITLSSTTYKIKKLSRVNG